MITAEPLLGGIELGGTKCVCVLGTGPTDVRTKISIPTGSDPEATLRQAESILHNSMALNGPVAALGIASFGPLDLARQSATYGSITSTAKPGWGYTQIAQRLQREFKVPIGFDTDVNGAALAEGRWGAAQGLTDFAYITVGTGVGVGLIVNGRPVHGFAHPELGHIRIARASTDRWPGSCPFHGDCIEGLISGTAIAARTGIAAHALPEDHPVWYLVSEALAQLLHTLTLATAPQRILIGGGVLGRKPKVIAAAREMLLKSLNGYSVPHGLTGGVQHYVTFPGLDDLAGPLGALAVAQLAL